MYKRTAPPPAAPIQTTSTAPTPAATSPVAAALARARLKYGRENETPIVPTSTRSLHELDPADAKAPATDAGGQASTGGVGAAPVGADRFSLPEDNDASLHGLDMIKRFLKLDEIGRDLETIRKEADARIDAMKTRIAEWFAEQGVETIRVAGYTVYMRRDLWVSYKKPDIEGLDTETAEAVKREAKERLIESLKVASWEVPDPDQPGMTRQVATSYLIHEDYHPSALAALVRELPIDDHGDPLMPPGLKDHIEIYYNVKPCKRKSK